jgi:hypothetical protein
MSRPTLLLPNVESPYALDNSGTFVIHERRLTPDVSLGAALECDRWTRSAAVVYARMSPLAAGPMARASWRTLQ